MSHRVERHSSLIHSSRKVDRKPLLIIINYTPNVQTTMQTLDKIFPRNVSLLLLDGGEKHYYCSIQNFFAAYFAKFFLKNQWRVGGLLHFSTACISCSVCFNWELITRSLIGQGEFVRGEELPNFYNVAKKPPSAGESLNSGQKSKQVTKLLKHVAM